MSHTSSWISDTRLSLSLVTDSKVFSYPQRMVYVGSYNPRRFGGFGLFRFRSPLLTESLRFLFLRVLRCFSSPGTPPAPQVVRDTLTGGLLHSETAGSLDTRLLPDEYRRQLRPSSALTTKSSTVCFKRKTGCLRLLPMFSSLFKEQTVDRGRFELPAFAMQKRRSTH